MFPEYFRILAPAQVHPKPQAAFHVGGLNLFHFTSASALATVFTIGLVIAAIARWKLGGSSSSTGK